MARQVAARFRERAAVRPFRLGLGWDEDAGRAFQPNQVAQLGAALWGLAALCGFLGALLPHGEGVDVKGWVALSVLAALTGIWTWFRGMGSPPLVRCGLAGAGIAAVSLAVYFAHGTPVVYAAAMLYVVLSIFIACFYPTPVFIVCTLAQAAATAVVMVPSGEPGGVAAWAVTVCMTGAVATVVHLQRRQLARIAMTDPLTGLLNRRAFEPVLERELARAERCGEPLCVAVLDLDHFKEVNDRAGHHAGDAVLVEVADAWLAELRAEDVLARAGGDEFVLLLPSATPEGARATVRRLSASGSHAFSSGIASAHRGDSVEDVLKRADAACYEAKQGGRGRIAVEGRRRSRAARVPRTPV